MDVMPKWAEVVLVPLISLLLAAILSALVILGIGEDPVAAVKLMVSGALGSTYGWGYTLYYATNFMFTGLCVAIAFHARLFNIGGEGQAMLGGLGVALACLYIPWPHWSLALIGAAAMAAVFGAAWAAIPGLPLHIFRLAGIYGPGRGPFAKVRAGTARRILKPGQVFSRTHVEDIAQVLAASIARPRPGGIYNVCDDDPAPPEDVIAEAARLLGLPVPEAEDFATAEMTPMARSFYAESKKVRNDRIKTELGVELIYPDYRAGLAALAATELPG